MRCQSISFLSDVYGSQIWNGCNFIDFLTAYIHWPGAGRIKTGTYRNDTQYTHYRHDIHRANVSPYGTVDGTNPSPVDMVNILLFTTGFTHPNGGWPWDFWSINSIGYTVFCFFSILNQTYRFFLSSKPFNKSTPPPWAPGGSAKWYIWRSGHFAYRQSSWEFHLGWGGDVSSTVALQLQDPKKRMDSWFMSKRLWKLQKKRCFF